MSKSAFILWLKLIDRLLQIRCGLTLQFLNFLLQRFKRFVNLWRNLDSLIHELLLWLWRLSSLLDRMWTGYLWEWPGINDLPLFTCLDNRNERLQISFESLHFVVCDEFTFNLLYLSPHYAFIHEHYVTDQGVSVYVLNHITESKQLLVTSSTGTHQHAFGCLQVLNVVSHPLLLFFLWITYYSCCWRRTAATL